MRRFLIGSLLLILISGSLLAYWGYSTVRRQTVASWAAQQKALSGQVSLSLKHFFDNYRKILYYLASDPNIVAMNHNGRREMRRFFSLQGGTIKAITRIDRQGRIVYTVPVDPKAIGADVSRQPHNAFIMRTHQPVLSDIFTAVQGYRAVAYAIPVFQGHDYRGCLTILISFDYLAASYLERLHLGNQGFSWVLSQNGKVIYRSRECPFSPRQLAGAESCYQLEQLLNLMLKGKQGMTRLSCTIHGAPYTVPLRVFYAPVPLGHTFWTLAICAPESAILSGMERFALGWMGTTALFLAAGLVLAFYLARSWTALSEIQKRRRAEAALQQSEKRYRSLVENIPYGIFTASVETGRFRFLNHHMCRMFGYEYQQPGRQTLWDLLDPAEHPTARKRLEMHRRGELPPEATFTYTCRRRDGSTLRCEVAISLIMLEGETVLQGILRDISEQERLENQLRHAQKMEAVGTLASGIAHNFNNILHGIYGLVQLAGDDPLTGDQPRRRLRQVEELVERGTKLIGGLLSFSRKSESHFTILDLNHEIRQAVEILSYTLPKNITLDTRLAPSLPPIKGDPDQIAQVIMNLAFNAADAMPNGGELTIHSSLVRLDARRVQGHDALPGPYVQVAVQDTGVGMDAETQDKAFDPFFTTKGVGKGTGLGLSIVYSILRSHRGFAQLHSRPGQGTRVELFFPVDESAGALARPPAA